MKDILLTVGFEKVVEDPDQSPLDIIGDEISGGVGPVENPISQKRVSLWEDKI